MELEAVCSSETSVPSHLPVRSASEHKTITQVMIHVLGKYLGLLHKVTNFPNIASLILTAVF